MTKATTPSQVRVNGLEIGFRELGSGPPVLLIHGWPTSSFLWRNVAPVIAEQNRVVAIDLPGFGASSKPLDRRYAFGVYEAAMDGLLEELGIGDVAVAGHDLGGPIAVHWVLRNRDRATRLALTNTLIYPEFSEAVQEFVTACATPGLREELTSPAGLEQVMHLGLTEQSKLTDDVLAAVFEPFRSAEARRALANAGIGLEFEGFQEIAQELPNLDLPVRIVYGTEDRILPDVAQTMDRVARDLPQAVVTALPGCGHFLQEEAADHVAALLADFFGPEELS